MDLPLEQINWEVFEYVSEALEGRATTILQNEAYNGPTLDFKDYIKDFYIDTYKEKESINNEN